MNDQNIAVVAACRVIRQRGDSDPAAYNDALNMFRELHPETLDDEARERVAQIVFDAGNWEPEWLWNGVSIGPRWYQRRITTAKGRT